MVIAIKQLDMELFGGCNYSCIMCPQATGRESTFLKSMPYNLFVKIIDDALQYGLETISLHGSGEPTLNKNFTKCIKYVKSKNKSCYSFTNGYTLNKTLSENILDAELDVLRISAIGYDNDSYFKWMNKNAFDKILKNTEEFLNIREKLKGKTELHFYHLITDKNNLEYELEMYKKNYVERLGAANHEIWLMHNWAGTYNNTPYSRQLPNFKKRSCGRPFAPILQVRAGGIDNHYGAVVACCMVLGRDSEAVLGHLDTQTIEEILNSSPYLQLRLAHIEERFDDISYCRDCDQLYDFPESLVWTNIPDRKYGVSKMIDMDIRQNFFKK